MNELAERIALVQQRIAAAAARAQRSPESVRLVGVSKHHPAELVRAAAAAGLLCFGENRVQEAEPKIAALADLHGQIEWHLIGHLQTNKTRRAAQLFQLVHSVDSVRLAESLARAWQGSHPLPILIQVNVSGEATKDGFELVGWEHNADCFATFEQAVGQITQLPQLQIQGLMTIAPWGDNPELARPTFRSTRLLRDQLAARFPEQQWSQLSMGMTDDFEVAIEEGATIIRVGRALFGERG